MGVIRGFNLEVKSGKMRYRFACLKRTGVGKKVQKYTRKRTYRETNFGTNFLDRQWIKGKTDDHYIKSFELETDIKGRYYYYTFQCKTFDIPVPPPALKKDDHSHNVDNNNHDHKHRRR